MSDQDNNKAYPLQAYIILLNIPSDNLTIQTGLSISVSGVPAKRV